MGNRKRRWLSLLGTLILMSGCQNQNASEGSKIALGWTTESATLESLT